MAAGVLDFLRGRCDVETGSLHRFSLMQLFMILPILTTLTCLCTWALSSCKSRAAPPGSGHEPPVAPYWIPYLQHLPWFLSDPNRTFQSWKERYPQSPFTLVMMNTKFHVFSSSATASHIFGRSRDFVFEPVVASMMENGVNLPVVDRPKFQLPLKAHHLLSEKELVSRQFLSENHSIYLKYLTSTLLEDVMKVYMDKFHLVLAGLFDVHNEEWVTVNYHELMRKTIFEASVVTFFGNRLQAIWPNMWEDWKLFNDATFAGVRSNFSFYLRPKALAARERMLRAFDKWVDCELEDWPVSDGVWNEKWGIRMNWEREELGRKSGFSHRGRACLQASFLFVIVTNSAPMATWFSICVFRSPGGLEKYRKEINSIVLRQDERSDHEMRFDMPSLKKNQYVQGVWKEALRTGSASAAARVVAKDSEIEQYVVKRGSVVMIPVHLLHFDKEIFRDPEKIEPARWIVSEEASDTDHKQLQKQSANLRSFGGGTGLCSGRFVAEQEIISVVSTILLLFELEFVTPMEDFKLNPQSIGIMGPERDPLVKLKRRNVMLR